jgi:glycosyltransferase involved in cell wall biosynthesis
MLSEFFLIELVYIDTKPLTEENRNVLDNYCNKITPFIFFKFSFLKNTFIGFLKNRQPLQVNYYYFKEVQRYIDKNINNYDAIFCNHIRTTEYVRDFHLPKFVDLVDSIAMNYKKAYSKSRGLWKLIYGIEKKRVKLYEKKILNQFNKSFVISQIDKNFIAPNSTNLHVFGNYVQDLKFDKTIQVVKNRICFLGKMDYEPNVTAVLNFVAHVFPKIKKIIKDLEFIVIGAYPTKRIQNLEKIEGIKVTGFVDNPYNWVQSAQLFVAPMITGAGVQNKILEAMKMGKCVITTKIGAEGLNNLSGNEIVICKNENDMVKEIVNLFKNENQILEVGNNAKRYINNNYSEKVIKKQFQSIVDIYN